MPYRIEEEIILDLSDIPEPKPLRPLVFDQAKIAQALIDAGVLQTRDWDKDLPGTIEQGVDKWLKSTGMFWARDMKQQPLYWLNLAISDDVLEGMKLSDFQGGVNSWWHTFGRKDADMSEGIPPVGAFAMTSGSHKHILKLKTWGRRLVQEFGEEVTGDIFGALNEALDTIEALTPAWVLDRVTDDEAEWDDIEREEGEGPMVTSEMFLRHVPRYAVRTDSNLARMNAVINIGARRYESRCFLVLRAAYELAKALEAEREDYERRCQLVPGESHSQNHLHFLEACYPPIWICWSGKHGEDPCLRHYDAIYHSVQNSGGSDTCWIHCFDVEKPGGPDVPGTVAYAIEAVKRHITLMIPLFDLIKFLSFASPRKTDPARIWLGAQMERIYS